jgi:hypothetical protein
MLEELNDADAAGMRVISSLWPGDQFWYKKHMHTISKIQMMVDKKTCRVATDRGEYLLHGMLMFPVILSDEHAGEESSDGMWLW